MGGGGVLVASAERGALISCLIQGNSNTTWDRVIVWHDKHSGESERERDNLLLTSPSHWICTAPVIIKKSLLHWHAKNTLTVRWEENVEINMLLNYAFDMIQKCWVTLARNIHLQKIFEWEWIEKLKWFCHLINLKMWHTKGDI